MIANSFRIAPYKIEEYDVQFKGAYVFQKNGKNLLLSDDGYMVLLDNELLEQVEGHRPDEALVMLLLQHRFATGKEPEDAAPLQHDAEHPVFFMIDLTNRCNMACRYCLREGDGAIPAKVISAQTVTKICDYILDYCRKTGEEYITIQPWGGEPLLETKRIFQIQDYMMENGICPCISIETNGVLLNEDLIAELRRRNIWVSVSIDGPKAIHDSQRVFSNGKPTHSIVESNLIKLRDAYEGRVSVIATVTRNTYRDIRAILRYLAVDLNLRNVKINFVHKSSFVDNEALCMNREEIQACTIEIYQTLLELVREGYQAGDYNIYTKLMNLLYNPKTDVCICSGCCGGRKMIAFDYHGNLYPCDVTDYPEECLGTIDEPLGLVEVIERAVSEKTYFREKKQPQCETCPWRCYCLGGCTVHVKAQGKQPPAIDEIECAVNQALYPAMVETILTEPELVNRLLRIEAL